MTSSLFTKSKYNFGGGWTDKSLSEMSDDEFDNYYSQTQKLNNRRDKLFNTNSSNNNNNGFGSSNNSSSSSNSSSSGTGGLNIGGLGFGDFANQAKDLANFRLGLDFQQMDKAAGLRENESQNNFGRTQKLTDQTFGWQQRLNTDTQTALTDRLQRELDNRRNIQDTDISQQNFAARRAINLATRRLGR